MSPAKVTISFFARLALVYTLLVVPWPGLRAGYATGYRAVMNSLFGSFGADGAVRLRPALPATEAADTELDIANRRTGIARSARHSTIVTGYLPTAEIGALILATPIPWRRKWKALLAGLAIIQALVLLRVGVALVFGFSANGPIALFHPGPFGRGVLTVLFNVVAQGISFTYVPPVVVWIVTAIRSTDIQRWTRQPSRPVAANRAGTEARTG